MRTLILFIASFIPIVLISTCNSVVEPPTENNIPQNLFQDSINTTKKCCNSGIIPGCNPNEIVSLWVTCDGEEYDIFISAECCCEIYQFYGYPQNLFAYDISCYFIGSQVCIPNE